jgi:hypothetical protein
MIHNVQPAAFGVTGFQILNAAGEVDKVDTVLNASASWTARLIDASGAPVLTKGCSISGNDYNSWGSDDAYIVQKTAEQLGLTLA